MNNCIYIMIMDGPSFYGQSHTKPVDLDSVHRRGQNGKHSNLFGRVLAIK